jgi:ATP-grasp domain, R2K clade family 3
MINWVIQTNYIDSVQVEAIGRCVKNSSANLIGVEVIPFCDDVKLTNQPIGNSVIPYGSTKLSRLAIKNNWSGLFFNDNFNVISWNKNRDDMLNQDSEIMKVSETKVWASDKPEDDVYFIRPIEDLKSFNGTVATIKEIKNWMGSVDSGNFSFDESCVVSIATPKNILAEWRWFVVDGKVVDGSLYRIRGQKLMLK